MKLHDYRIRFINALTQLYDVQEAEGLFAFALQELKGWKRIDMAMHPDVILSDEEVASWNAVLEQLRQHKPVQYVFGKAYFYGLEFVVNSDTLIPRPETEGLVEWIIQENRSSGKIKILDIGTGSGCIAVSLAKNLINAEVTAIDVSPEALEIARRNAAANAVTVNFVQADILTTDVLPDSYDIVVSNPPYVRNLEKHEIKDNVLQYEPHLALFVEDDDALLFYRKIALLGQQSLKPGGRLFFEINQYLGEPTALLLNHYDFDAVAIRKDLLGNDRMARAVKK